MFASVTARAEEAAAPSRRSALAIACALAAGTFLLYARTAGFAFLDFDDDLYVTRNPHVSAGLTWSGIRWALTSLEVANWHPLTWWSHMLDVELFGVSAGAHHLVNAGLHAVNAALLFLVLRKLTGATWRSAVVAALFAAHPLHVESVAWVAERKDVLSTGFGLLALGAYARYAERPGPWRYAAVAVAFALSLAAKPMLLTLPFLLLLLDVWPLGRIRGLAPSGGRDAVPLARAVLEKLPLLLLSAASAAVTLVAQRGSGAVDDALPLGQRVANAAVSYVAYLGSTVWPADLAPFYPYERGGPGVLAAIGCAAALAIVSAGALRARAHPWVAVGWFWYLGTLVPVIGLVQVGMQARADRYTYFPLIGAFVVVVWGAEALSRRFGRAVPSAAAVVVLAALCAATWRQLGWWSSHETLFRHTIAVTRENANAHAGLAGHLGRSGRIDEAMAEARAAIAIDDSNALAWNVLSAALRDRARPTEAVEAARRAVRSAPQQAEGWRNLGVSLRAAGDPGAALEPLLQATRLLPTHAATFEDLASVQARLGRIDDAVASMERAVALDPAAPRFWFNLGVVRGMRGDGTGAVAAYQRALQLDPGHAGARRNLEAAMAGSRAERRP